MADAARLKLTWARRDRRKMGDYLDSVREVERRIQKAEAQNAAKRGCAGSRSAGRHSADL